MVQLRTNNSAVEKRFLADPERYEGHNPCEGIISAIVAMEYCLGESNTLGPYPPDGPPPEHPDTRKRFFAEPSPITKPLTPEEFETLLAETKARWLASGKRQQKMLEDLYSIGSIRLRPLDQ